MRFEGTHDEQVLKGFIELCWWGKHRTWHRWNLGQEVPLWRDCADWSQVRIVMAQPPQKSRPLPTPSNKAGSESEPISHPVCTLEWCLHQRITPAILPVEVQQASIDQRSLTSQREWRSSEHQGSAWSLSPSLLYKIPLSHGTYKLQICRDGKHDIW